MPWKVGREKEERRSAPAEEETRSAAASGVAIFVTIKFLRDDRLKY